MPEQPDFSAARALLDGWTNEGILPGAAVLVQQRGERILEYTSGAACLEPYIPATLNHVWAIASISKPVAATGLMQLVEAGHIRLDQPVSELLPDYTGPGLEQVLVRHLVTHSSGIPDTFPPFEMIQQRGIPAALASMGLLYPPGTRCSYSTPAFELVGALVQKYSGLPWARYAEECLFAPLNMSASTFSPPPGWSSRIAVVYGAEDSPRVWPNDPQIRAFAMPGGGMFSTLHDLARFGQAFLDHDTRLISEDGYREMLAVQTPGLLDMENDPSTWGLGWYLNRDGLTANGTLLSAESYRHGGATSTKLIVDPAYDAVIVFLANRVDIAATPLHAQLTDTILAQLERKA